MSDEIINQLTERIQRLKDGYEGCCTACEPVGEMNQKLRQEVEQLRKERDEVEPLLNELWERRTEATEMREEITRLRTERDEARRYSCDLEARIIVLEEDRRDTSNKFGTNPCSEIILPDYPLAREPKEIAKQKGWDCFKDNA